MARSYHVSAPPRLAIQGPGTGLGAGAPMPLQAATSGSSPGIDVGAALNTLMADVLGSAQVLLGVVLLGVGLAVVISQTRAGAAVGSGAASGVKRGLRLIPGVGALV